MLNKKITENVTKINYIKKDICYNKNFLKSKFNNSFDVVFYEFVIFNNIKALVIYIEEIVKKEVLDRDVLYPLINNSMRVQDDINNLNISDVKRYICVSNIRILSNLDGLISKILSGDSVIIIEGLDDALVISSKGWEKRQIEEPTSEAVIRGPREGFVESININRSLIRRKIKNNNLIFEEYNIGKQTKTSINLVYIKDIVNENVLNELRRKINKIDTDAILETGYIEEFIDDNKYAPLSTIGQTQKPDVLASKILEGRVGILCDGTPHVLTVPHLFIEVLQVGDDYYRRAVMGTILRCIRFVALFSAIFLPALYVALETFHQDMIPTVLLITMASSGEGIPFPAAIEAFIMVISLEFLKESGVRLPRPIGSAVSIVGALVLGESAVNAGLVSGALVVVIAFTAISTFIVPEFDVTITIFRLIMLLFASIVGLFGITAIVFVLVIYLSSLRSFGVPYLSPLAPIDYQGLKDYLLRAPVWMRNHRPRIIEKRNVLRNKDMFKH